MAQPLRIEDPNRVSFITIRTVNELLLFANNQALEDEILAKIAKYQEDLGVILYGLTFMDNHLHLIAQFPGANRARFMQRVCSMIAKAVHKHVPGFERGQVWGRRYSEEEVPRSEDVEDRFYYLALQPVAAGLTERISDYPRYNSFSDAVSGRARSFKVLDTTAYNNAKRFNPKVRLQDYSREVKLRFARLPGYEDLPQKEYKELLLARLEARRIQIVHERLKEGKTFLGRTELLKIKPHDRPKSPKISKRDSHRPLVLTSCPETRKMCLARYFATLSAYREASARYLAGQDNVRFPPGTYKPPRLQVPPAIN